MSGDLYCNPVQAQRRPPTDYENRLGDALEAAFADGIHDL
ncbi:MAG: recombinase-like helix-turn-helix domain-containing protein, partial [Candidatus Eiseniibacteriota bacterium]